MLKETEERFGFVVIIFIIDGISIWGVGLDLAPMATPFEEIGS